MLGPMEARAEVVTTLQERLGLILLVMTDTLGKLLEVQLERLEVRAEVEEILREPRELWEASRKVMLEQTGGKVRLGLILLVMRDTLGKLSVVRTEQLEERAEGVTIFQGPMELLEASRMAMLEPMAVTARLGLILLVTMGKSGKLSEVRMEQLEVMVEEVGKSPGRKVSVEMLPTAQLAAPGSSEWVQLE